jgi:murein DD-endopeptidase MepM/ murein hydrolase activator NlpD
LNKTVKTLKDLFQRRVTIMVVPHDTAPVRQVRISLALLLAAGVFVLGLAGTAAIGLINQADYTRTRIANGILKEKSLLLAGEITEVRRSMRLSQTLDNKVRAMLGLKAKPAAGENDPGSLARMVEDNTVSKENISRYINEIKLEGWLRSKNLQEMTQLMAATPIGSPVRGGWITSRFGYRTVIGQNVGTGGVLKGFHPGIDIAHQTGTPVRATAAGRVTVSGVNGGYGKLVCVSHGCGYTTYYGHNSKLKVKEGDWVKRGQVIALLGRTGNATGPHVHYEVRRYGVAINPLRYIRIGR